MSMIAVPQIAFAKPCSRYGQLGRTCSLHGHCREADRVEAGEARALTGCDDFMSGTFEYGGLAAIEVENPIQVRSDSAGIGDVLLTLAIGEGLKAKWPGTELVVVCNPWLRQWLELFDGFHVSPEPVRGPMFFCEHNVGTKSFRAFRSQGKARWEYWASEFGAAPKFPAVKALPAAALRRAVPLAGRVLLAPFAAYKERTWALERWLETERLLLAMGFRCVILSGGSRDMERFVSDKMVGEPASHVAALMQSAVCLLGNDSGMAHLAGMLGVPAVAICSAASDANIFGLYPSVQMIGGRAGLESVRAEDAVEAVRRKVRAGLGAFPVYCFGSIVLERDRWRLECWNAVYAALWRTVKELNPKRIVEVGTRAGYSAWVMAQACSEASIIGIDADFDGDMAVTHGGFKGACEHARAIMTGRGFELRIADSQKLERLPECDLVYADGDHSRLGCLSDLLLAERSGAKTILADDTQFGGVRDAIAEFLSGRPEWECRYIASDTGLALLRRASCCTTSEQTCSALARS